MKKIFLTLVISIVSLGLASFLFSFEKKSIKNPAKNKVIQIAQLPSSRNAFLTASLNSNFIPIRNWSIEELDIQAKAAAVFDPSGEKFLYQKNTKEKLPIASLTKIITAIVTLENLRLDDIITISKKAVMTEGENGRLVIGEKLSVRDLLYIMLMESSNDAAVALANATDNDFVTLMNKKIKDLGLKNTHFVDSTGISKLNYSTAFDLARVTKHSFDKPLMWQILGTKEITIYSQDGTINHHLTNTNKLLGEIPQIIGGKTGFTDEAGGCMLTMIKIPSKPGEYLIIIILGSENRELETQKLINWIQKAYVW